MINVSKAVSQSGMSDAISPCKAPDEKELELINKYTRRKYTSKELYTFSVVLCDNEVDRDMERFSDEALISLSQMFIGKTGISDHNPKSENQQARIYDCITEKVSGKKNSLGMDYMRVLAKAYIPITEKNKDFISDIDSGIKKEVSISCSVKKKMCSICACDLSKDGCSHIRGKEYNGQLCHTVLSQPGDAYEWSFVAVPAQREAGVVKSFSIKGGENMEEIFKSLSQGAPICLTGEEALKLYSAFSALKEDAKLGKQYKSDLRDEFMKLCALAQPEMLDTMGSISLKMSVSELKSLRDFYKGKASSKVTPTPQLFKAKDKPDTAKNSHYSI